MLPVASHQSWHKSGHVCWRLDCGEQSGEHVHMFLSYIWFNVVYTLDEHIYSEQNGW